MYTEAIYIAVLPLLLGFAIGALPLYVANRLFNSKGPTTACHAAKALLMGLLLWLLVVVIPFVIDQAFSSDPYISGESTLAVVFMIGYSAIGFLGSSVVTAVCARQQNKCGILEAFIKRKILAVINNRLVLVKAGLALICTALYYVNLFLYEGVIFNTKDALGKILIGLQIPAILLASLAIPVAFDAAQMLFLAVFMFFLFYAYFHGLIGLLRCAVNKLRDR